MANKVQELQQQILELTKTINENGKATKEQAKQLQKLEKEYNRISSKVMPQYRKGQEQINKELNKAKKFTDSVSKSSQGYFGRLKTAIGTLSRYALAYAGVNAVMTIGRELFINSAKRAIQLEKALADVAAVANITAGDMQRLERVVFDVAGTTSFTAIEVVELQKQLAKLGTSVDDIENLTRPVALLSQALGEEPGGVAAALKKALNQFQQTSDQADRFSNALVGAVNESALSLNDLGTALQYVGPLASQSGLTFEQTAALLGVLADNGFRASRAGTGLANILIEASKDGRPFLEFLEDVSTQNLTTAEATDVFGKRSAAAAITLSKNIEKVKELSGELEDNTRLLTANAKQMSSTQGQIDLLSSAYNRASIRLGDYITQTEFFIEILEKLDPSIAGQSRAFKFLANASEEGKDAFDDLTNAMVGFQTKDEEISEGLEARWSIIAEAGILSSKQIQNLRNQYDKMIQSGKDMPLSEFLSLQAGMYNLEEFEDAASLLEGVIELGSERAKVIREQRIAQAAQNEDYKEAINLTNRLTSSAKEGLLTDEEQLRVSEGLRQKLTELQQQREKSSDLEEITILEKRISLYEDLAVSVENLENNQDAINKREAAASKAAFKLKLETIKSELEAELDAINAITETELAGAKNAEEAGQIRLKQEKLVQAAYANSLRSVEKLKNIYPEFAEEIQSAAENYEKFVKFSQSAIGKEGVNILQDYKKEFDDLGKKLKDGKISLGEYETKNDALEASLISSIVTLKNSTDANEELKDMLDKVVVAYLEAKKGAEEYINSTEKEAKKIKILGKEFVKDLTLEEAIGMSLATTGDIISKFNDTALENTKSRLEAEKDLIENRYQVEQDILKSQLDNQLITESQYRQKQKELRKAQVRDENEIDKKLFEAQKKRDRQNATTGYLQALASIIPNLIVYDKEANPIGLSIKAALSGALATAAYGAELSAISQRKFVDRKFAEGGMVNGPSHEQGGVPFTVQGQGGYEMEGGEYIVNKRATAMHRDLLERINNSTRTAPRTGDYVFAQGGLVNSPVNESVDYLKAIAEATTSTAIGVSKPVRAYVSDKDLRSNATERRIRDRNDRL